MFKKILIGLSIFCVFIIGLGAWDIRQSNIKSIVSGNTAQAGIFDDITNAIDGHIHDIKDRILVDDQFITGDVISESKFTYSKDSIHWANGTVKIVEANGKYYIQLGEDFEAGLAPDLYILTSESVIKTQTDLDLAKKDNLIKLAKGKGATVYEITNVEDINSIVIWCQRFNQLMGSSVISE